MAVSAQAVRQKIPPKTEAPPSQAKMATPAADPESPLRSVQEQLAAQGLDPTLEARGLVISLPHSILFAPGDDQVDAAAYPVVERIAEVIRRLPNAVTLVGHADAAPIRNRRFRNNWELSAARSLRLLELLVTRYGVPEHRLSTAGYGSQQPKDTNETPEGRAANRRVEIVILHEAVPGAAEAGLTLRPAPDPEP